MTLTIQETSMVLTLIQGSNALQAEAKRIETSLKEYKRFLEVTIPNLIRANGELKAQLTQLYGQQNDIKITNDAALQAKQDLVNSLTASIAQVRAKIVDLKQKKGWLEGEIQKLISPQGQLNAISIVRNNLARMGF